jgi:hypothetical protein
MARIEAALLVPSEIQTLMSLIFRPEASASERPTPIGSAMIRWPTRSNVCLICTGIETVVPTIDLGKIRRAVFIPPL